MPDRERVIGQLSGRITHSLSAKDFAFYKLQEEKEKKEIMKQNLLYQKLRKKKNKNKIEKIVSEEEIDFTNEIKRFIKEKEDKKSKIMIHDKGNRYLRLSKDSSEYSFKSVYTSELNLIESQDLNNWEMKSSNRQRKLYNSLYKEYDAMGIASKYIHSSCLFYVFPQFCCFVSFCFVSFCIVLSYSILFYFILFYFFLN